jgi:hypothetical protein
MRGPAPIQENCTVFAKMPRGIRQPNLLDVEKLYLGISK